MAAVDELDLDRRLAIAESCRAHLSFIGPQLKTLSLGTISFDLLAELVDEVAAEVAQDQHRLLSRGEMCVTCTPSCPHDISTDADKDVYGHVRGSMAPSNVLCENCNRLTGSAK